MKTISFEECSKLKVDLALRSGSLGDSSPVCFKNDQARIKMALTRKLEGVII